MKRILSFICITSALLIVNSCSNDDQMNVLPGAGSNFTINIRLEDQHLNSAGNMAAYFSSTTAYSEYKEKVKDVAALKVFGKVPLAGSYYGIGGVLVINRGTYGNGIDFGAYDLACPYEAQQQVRIIPNNNNRAVCPKCGSQFELFTGKVIEGPALKKTKILQPYYVRKTGDDEYRVIY